MNAQTEEIIYTKWKWFRLHISLYCFSLCSLLLMCVPTWYSRHLFIWSNWTHLLWSHILKQTRKKTSCKNWFSPYFNKYKISESTFLLFFPLIIIISVLGFLCFWRLWISLQRWHICHASCIRTGTFTTEFVNSCIKDIMTEQCNL